jgi:hypothetical protein
MGAGPSKNIDGACSTITNPLPSLHLLNPLPILTPLPPLLPHAPIRNAPHDVLPPRPATPRRTNHLTNPALTANNPLLIQRAQEQIYAVLHPLVTPRQRATAPPAEPPEARRAAVVFRVRGGRGRDRLLPEDLRWVHG